MDAVGQVADCDRVSIGIVVLLQHVKIFGDDKSWAGCSARKKQNALARFRKWFAISASNAERLPLRERRTTAHIVESAWNDHFETPGQGGIPFPFVQIICGRTQNIRHAAPDIDLPVSREIDGVI